MLFMHESPGTCHKNGSFLFVIGTTHVKINFVHKQSVSLTVQPQHKQPLVYALLIYLNFSKFFKFFSSFVR